MAKKLKQLSVTAVALVPRGSNPDAHIAFYKSDATHAPVPVAVDTVEKATFNDILLAEQRRKALYKLADSIYTMQDAMYSAIHADNPSADIRKSVKEFSAYVNQLLDAMDSNTLDGDADVAKQLVLKKAEGVFARFFNQEPQTMSKTIATPPAAAEQTPPAVEINLAELPANVQAFLKAQQAQTEAAMATAKAAQDAADRAIAAGLVETEKRETLEYTAIAKAEIPHLPGTAEEKGAILLAMAKSLTSEQYTAAFNLIKAGGAAMTSQTIEKGVSENTTAATVEGSELVQFFDKAATDLMAADPKVTVKAVALTKVYKVYPKKYRELIEEEKRTGRRQA